MSVTTAPQSVPTNIVFIDTAIQDYQSIAASIAAGTEIVLIGGKEDGLAQIAATLAGRSGIDAVHIFSHGSDGQLDLGSTLLNADTVGSHAAALATIGAALNPDADILLYGCDTGAGPRGAALLDALALATGADIAASTDLTGAAALGGDWVLERSTGTIEAGSPFANELSDFAGVLETFVFSGGETGFFESPTVTMPVLDNQGNSVILSFGIDTASTDAVMYFDNGLYAWTEDESKVALTITAQDGRSFDLNGFSYFSQQQDNVGYDFKVTITHANGAEETLNVTPSAYGVQVHLGTSINDATKVVISSVQYVSFNDFDVTDVKPASATPADTTPPVITGISIPNAPMKIGSVVTATITVAADTDTYTLGAGSTIAGQALGNLVKTGAATYTATFTIAEGAADIAAGANIPVNLVLRDSANNASNAYTTAIAQSGDAIDANRPAAPTVRLTAADDSGRSSSDGVTKVAQPTLAGSAEANSTVTLKLDGVEVASNIHADGAGNWTWKPGAMLADGVHTFVAKATDAAGNAGADGSPLQLTIDTMAPGTVASMVAFASDSGSSASDLVTNVAQQTISGVLSAGLATGEKVMVSLDNGAHWLEALSATGGSGWTIAGQTLVSSNTMQVKVVDLAGNEGPVQAFAYVLDTTAPAGSIGSIGISADSGSSATDFVTRIAAQTVSATLSSPLANGEVLYGSTDGGAHWTDISSRVSGSAISWTTSLMAGGNELWFKVVDAAGNQGVVARQAYTLDTGAPAASVTAASIGAGNDVTSARSSETGSLYLVKSGLAVATQADLEAAVLAGAAAKASVAAAATDTTIATTGLATGDYLVYAVDQAGNLSAASAGTVTLLAAPTTVAASVSFSIDSGASNTDFVTRFATQNLSGTLSAATVNGESVEVSLDDGHSWQTATNLTGSASWTLNGQTLAGSSTLQVRVSNAVASSAPFKQAYVLDTVAPSAHGVGIAFSNDSGASPTDLITHIAQQTISGTLSADLAPGERVWVSLDNGASFTETLIDGPRAWSLPGRTLAGSGTVEVKVVDLAGNAGPSTPSAYVLDTVAPTTSAGAIGISADTGSSSTDLLTRVAAQTVSATLSAGLAPGEALWASADGGQHWTDISATVSGSAVTWTGVTLQAGANALQFKVVDLAGNEGALASQAYTLDTVAPGAMAAAVLFSNDSGASSSDLVTNAALQAVSGTLDRATANGESVRVSLDDGAHWIDAQHVAGSTGWTLDGQVLSGSNTVRVQVVDAAGNLGAVFSQAYVLDTTAPVASVPAAAIGMGNEVAGARSSEAGSVYLVKADFAVAGVADLDAALQAGAATRATVADGATGVTIATTGLAGGSYVVYAVDLAGNLSAASTGTVTLLAAPGSVAASVSFSNDSGASGSDFVTRIAAQDLSGTLSAATAAGERVEVSLDDGHSWQTAANDTGSSRWSLDGQTLAGSGTLQVRVSNAVASSASLKQAYVLDTAAPEARPLGVAFSVDSGDSSTDLVTNTPVQTLSGTLSADLGAGEHVWVSLDNGATFLQAVSTGARGWSLDTLLAEGAHGLQVMVVDSAGNEGHPYHASYVLLTAAPSSHLGALALSADTGSSATDFLTNVARQTVSAALSAPLDDGVALLGSSDGGQTWTDVTAMVAGGRLAWTGVTLLPGSGSLQLKAVDLAGNESVLTRQDYTLDTTPPAVAGVPALAPDSDSGSAGDGVTRFQRVVLSGTAEALAEVTLYDSVGGSVIGTVRADARGAWQVMTSALADGDHAITVRQTDGAGNTSAPGAVLALTIDSTAPAAPDAPRLAGAAGAGGLAPTITGSAEAHAMVTLYDGAFVIGRASADALGTWSVPTTLGYGSHALTVVQADAAGNVSAPSTALALEIVAAPTAPGTPVTPAIPGTLVDGMPVQLTQVTLPGSVAGSAVSVPIVSAGRSETSGASGVADIPLATGAAGTLLLAQLAPGYGLSASGANVSVASGIELLIASIKAATPTHAAADQGHLTGNGQDFLAGLAASGTLLVQTVKPVSAGPLDGMLTLSGPADATSDATSGAQSVALVIDAGGLAAGSTIALQQVDFAAVIGNANVLAQGGKMVLSGDAASQHFTLAAGSAGAVYAGGGDDILAFGQAQGTTAPAASGAVSAQVRAQADTAATAATLATLHGGLASDTAVFGGARADYDIEQHNGYLVVASHAAPQAAALLVNVEHLQFSDASVTVEDSAALDTIAGIYQTLLGRQADLYGFAYWAEVHDKGESWGSIALHMIDSAEFKASAASFDGTPAHDIGLLYQALFERAPEAAGLAYWEGRMAHGATLEQVASEMVQSVEMVGHQRGALDWDFTM